MGKHSKVSSSTEWRLGENVVLRLMESLTLTVSFDIFITLSHLFVCLPRQKKVEKKYIQEQQRTKTKSTPLLQPEHGFCQQNGPELGQLQDWYQDEKMVVVPACLNGRCCSSGCVSVVSFYQR